MSGESPLGMMRSASARPGNRGAGHRRRWPWLIVAAAATAVVIPLVWIWLWHYAASIANGSLAGWVEREAAAGRVYACASQTIDGFPFGIAAHCVSPVAEIKRSQPPFTVQAQNVTFSAEIYHPTLLTGDVSGPLTVTQSGKSPAFLANWSRARVRVEGRPPYPESVDFILERPRVERGGENGEILFKAEHADLRSRVVSGTPSDNPVIETVLHLTAATAPTLHPLAAEPIEAQLDAVLRGFKDLAPKRWADRFREMQAAGGSLEVKSLRFARSDAIVIGEGAVTVNAHGKLDGTIRVAIVGVERIIPLLGIDRIVGRSIDRLAGSDGAGQGLSALDRLVPGLGNALRDTANASLVDNLKKMGQPTEVDKKPAIVLPLRFADGAVYLGMVPLGDVPPLF